MPIDTRAKKLSLLTYGVPWTRALPLGDGSFDQGDKQHLLHLYSGVLASTHQPLRRGATAVRRIDGAQGLAVASQGAIVKGGFGRKAVR